MDRVRYISDNLIYNRFDIYRSDDCKSFILTDNKAKLSYEFKYYCDVDKGYINVWGKVFPQTIFDQAIKEIFTHEDDTNKIIIQASGNNYYNQLETAIDTIIEVGKDTPEIKERVRAKGYYNLNRNKRRLAETKGDIHFIIQQTPIPNDAIELYFSWKRITHGREYGLTPEEYIKKFHVTHVFRLYAGDQCVSMVLYCKCENTVYVENLSYNPDYDQFSPGTIAYYMFLEEMKKTEIQYIFLGQAGLDYKKRFGSNEYKRYYGTIYRERVFSRINTFFDEKGIKTIAIYGLGTYGNRFWRTRDLYNVELLYGIDKNVREFHDIRVVSPDALKDVEPPDLVIVTMAERINEIDALLQDTNVRFIYFDELLERIGCKEES